MRSREWLLVGLLYACATLTAYTLLEVFAPGKPEMALTQGALVGSLAAGWFYHRRDQMPSPFGFRLAVGLLLASLCVVVASAIQWIWRPFELAAVSIPIAVVGTLVCPFLLIGVMRRAFRDVARPESVIGKRQAAAVALAAVVVTAACLTWSSVPAVQRPALVVRKLPGMTISLPAWQAAPKSSDQYDAGDLRLEDPEGQGRFLELRWARVGSDFDLATRIWTGMGLNVRSREPVTVAGHDGVRLLLENDDGSKCTAVTMWRCPEDGRWMYLLTFLNLPRERMLRTHQRIIDTIRCHTEGRRAPREPVFPTFDPPPGFTGKDGPNARAYVHPGGKLILIAAGMPGSADLCGQKVPPEAISRVVTLMGLVKRIDSPPTLHTVRNRFGTERNVWSFTAANESNLPVYMDWLAWHCPELNLTFVSLYATERPHDVNEGIEVLLRAECPVAK